jgi:hypothetical protein
MPYYKDGTEAKVGDQVFGKLYNTPGVRAGTIISITPGVESCNAMVGFIVKVDNIAEIPRREGALRMAVTDESRDALCIRQVKTEQHGSSGPTVALVECADYCATNELTHIGP